MNWRERLADWISGGALTRARWDAGFDLAREAANIAAQRDEAIKRAELAEEQLSFMAQDCRTGWENCKLSVDALRAILAARNIAEARKIAKQALGDDE